MTQLVLVEREPPIAVVLLNRPKQLNALSDELMNELVDALRELDEDGEVRCIVLGGSERAFAAGADIEVLSRTTPYEAATSDRLARWDSIRKVGKPIVAAVSGFCLGGGCELAMLCDLIVASESAQFGQPEINLGLMPGAGGTQRLTRAVGKAVGDGRDPLRALPLRARGAGGRARVARRGAGGVARRVEAARARRSPRRARWRSGSRRKPSTAPSRAPSSSASSTSGSRSRSRWGRRTRARA